jgi:hypothetical protein
MNYRISDELQKHLDWENLMKMYRGAGGHDEQMQGLFKNAKVIGHWNEGDYQGMVATCVELDGKFIIYNDYYGSCSGCDSWEGADDEEVRNMCIGLSNSALIFENLEDVKTFLKNPNDEGKNWTSWSEPAKYLLEEIELSPVESA